MNLSKKEFSILIEIIYSILFDSITIDSKRDFGNHVVLFLDSYSLFIIDRFNLVEIYESKDVSLAS